MDFATEPPAKIGVAEFMERLDEHHAEVKQEQIVRRQNPLPLHAQIAEIFHGNFQSEADN